VKKRGRRGEGRRGEGEKGRRGEGEKIPFIDFRRTFTVLISEE